jgi:RNA polymerase-binding transcription factor DksA
MSAKLSKAGRCRRLYDYVDKRKWVTMNLLPDPLTRELRAVKSHRFAQQRDRLLRIRTVLLQRIKRLAAEASEDTPGYSIHMADAATDSFDRDLTLGLASFEQEMLYEVDAALKRLDDGTYGVCELTGRPIPWERLEAIPWTRYSIQAEIELEGGSHPHIGSLGTVREFDEEVLETPFDLESESLSERSIEETPERQTSEETFANT